MSTWAHVWRDELDPDVECTQGYGPAFSEWSEAGTTSSRTTTGLVSTLEFEVLS